MIFHTYCAFPVVLPLARLGVAAAPRCTLSLCLALGMLPDSDHAVVMTLHAVDALTGLGEYEVVDPVLADFAGEAVGVEGVVAGHDGLIEDGLVAEAAVVRAVGAYGRAVREKK